MSCTRRTVVGGDLSGPAATFATRLTPAGAYLGVDTLVVGGDLQIGHANLQAGNLRLGGGKIGNVNFNGGGSLVHDAGLDPQAYADRLIQESEAFRAIPANSSIQGPGAQPAPLKFIAGPGEDVAVFHVSAEEVFGNSKVQQFELVANDATSVVINVSGESVDFQHGNMVGLFTSDLWRSQIVWNFYEATSILFGRQFNGSVLAPYAHLQNLNEINGGVGVASMDARGEVHLHGYRGHVPPGTAVPTPAAAGLGLALLGAVALRRGR